jgi:taurine dioxygenase
MSLSKPTLAKGSIGARWRIADFAAVAADAGALRDLQEVLDERLVIEITPEAPVTPQDIAALQRFLGEPEGRGGDMMVPGTDFLLDFAAAAKLDDGRPRTPAFIESLHSDSMTNGPAAYAVSYQRIAPPTLPMRFVDMRAVYQDLPDAMKTKLRGLRARHTARARPGVTPTPSTMQPLAAKHPRTGAPLLLLPNRRDSRLEGLPDDEGSALTMKVWQMAEASPARLEIAMHSNMLIVWDNIASLHDNPAFPRDQERSTWFFNIVNPRGIEPLTS